MFFDKCTCLLNKKLIFLDAKIIDWQMCSGSDPIVDISSILFFGTNQDSVEANLDKYLKIYFDTFDDTCKTFSIDCPFTSDDLKRKFNEKAYKFLFTISLYICYLSGEKPMKRTLWILKKLVQLLHYD